MLLRYHGTVDPKVANDRDACRPTALSAEYLRRIECLERLPEMQPGQDKSWVDRANRDWDEHFAGVRFVEKPR